MNDFSEHLYVSAGLERRLLGLAGEIGAPLLALDASTARGSVAAAGRRSLCELALDAAAMPSESLVTSIAAALAGAGEEIGAVGGIVVGLGPGSFTGLRVALATAKGLAYGAGIPVYGVSSLALIAAGAGPGLVAPVLDARRGEVFCALYDVGPELAVRAVIADDVRAPAAFAELLRSHAAERATLAVDAAVRDAAVASPPFAAMPVAMAAPRAAAGLLLAEERIRAREGENLTALTPRYLRASEAERALRVADR